MSYEIVKSIKIKGDEVLINCACNNVRPLWYSNTNFPYFSKILKEKGLIECETEILKAYTEGTFQSSIKNKYTKAMNILNYVYSDEWNYFKWDNLSSEEYRKRQESPEFKALLLKALNTSYPKQKYVIKKDGYFVRKVSSRHIFYGITPKVFDFKELAVDVAKQVNGEVSVSAYY